MTVESFCDFLSEFSVHLIMNFVPLISFFPLYESGHILVCVGSFSHLSSEV